MDAETDGTVLDLPRRKTSLMDAITRAAAAQNAGPVPPPASPPELEPEEEPPTAIDDLAPLPRPGDSYKAAYSRPGNKAMATLHCLLADGTRRGFSWGNFDSIDLIGGEPGQPPHIVLRFSGMVNVEVVIAGRKLDSLYDYLGDHRIRWLRELPPGKLATDPNSPVIFPITIRLVAASPY